MAHRKVNVDALVPDDEAFVETQPAHMDELVRIGQQRVSQAQNLIQQGQSLQALKGLLAVPLVSSLPLDQSLDPHKMQICQTIHLCLSQIKLSDINSALTKMTQSELDVLCKYLYKCMDEPQNYAPAVVLCWHEKLVEVAGVGAIVRTLANRLVV